MTDQTNGKDSKGRFIKGHKANAAGENQHTAKRKRADIKAYCQRNSMRAVKAIMQIVKDSNASAADRLKGAQYIIDRGYGKPETLTPSTGGMFQGAQIVVHTGFQDALQAPTVDITPNGHAVDAEQARVGSDADRTDIDG